MQSHDQLTITDMLAIAVPLSYNITLNLLPANFLADDSLALHSFTAVEQLHLVTKHATTVFLVHSQGLEYTHITIAQVRPHVVHCGCV